jgi:hypothetical protein
MSFSLGNTVAVVFGLLLIAIGTVLLVAARSPSDFRISRSIGTDSSPEKIVPLIANLHRFNEWNPFIKADPGARLRYSGAEAGAGAHCGWSSAGEAGVGTMTVAQVTPEAISMDLNFEKPFSAQNKVAFRLAPNRSGGTDVRWTMTGKRPFLHRVLAIFINFDEMIGGQFDSGLRDLKSRVN